MVKKIQCKYLRKINKINICTHKENTDYRRKGKIKQVKRCSPELCPLNKK